MANRAYLFVTDTDERDPFPIQQYPEEWYYDSRWCIPLAWFFFFRPDEVHLVPVQGWEEVCLRAEKADAVKLFDRRITLLNSLVDSCVELSRIAALRNDLEGMTGRFLVLNPDDVLGGWIGKDSWHAERFRIILTALDHPPLAPDVLSVLDEYVGRRDGDVDKTRGQMVGYTYVHAGRNYGFVPEGG